jgi:hypothetical protein
MAWRTCACHLAAEDKNEPKRRVPHTKNPCQSPIYADLIVTTDTRRLDERGLHSRSQHITCLVFSAEAIIRHALYVLAAGAVSTVIASGSGSLKACPGREEKLDSRASFGFGCGKGERGKRPCTSERADENHSAHSWVPS